MLRCHNVMTPKPICCLPTDSVATAARLMRRANIGSVPVVISYQTRKLIGIVTDRDLALKVIAADQDMDRTQVDAVMTPQPWTCLVDDPLEVALRIMRERQVRRIPVVDEQGHVVGIIAQADIATRTDDSEQTAEVVEDISQPSDDSDIQH